MDEINKKVKTGFMPGTIFGGALTLISILLLTGHTFYRFTKIWIDKEHTEHNNEIVIPDDDDSRLDLIMGDYNNSLNFIVGLQIFEDDETYPDFDILDNDYVEFVGYDMNNEHVDATAQILEEVYTVVKCEPDVLDEVLAEGLLEEYFPQALCFSKNDNVQLKANWFTSDWHSPTVGIAYCKNKPTCKAEPEIEGGDGDNAPAAGEEAAPEAAVEEEAEATPPELGRGGGRALRRAWEHGRAVERADASRGVHVTQRAREPAGPSHCQPLALRKPLLEREVGEARSGRVEQPIARGRAAHQVDGAEAVGHPREARAVATHDVRTLQVERRRQRVELAVFRYLGGGAAELAIVPIAHRVAEDAGAVRKRAEPVVAERVLYQLGRRHEPARLRDAQLPEWVGLCHLTARLQQPRAHAWARLELGNDLLERVAQLIAPITERFEHRSARRRAQVAK